MVIVSYCVPSSGCLSPRESCILLKPTPVKQVTRTFFSPHWKSSEKLNMVQVLLHPNTSLLKLFHIRSTALLEFFTDFLIANSKRQTRQVPNSSHFHNLVYHLCAIDSFGLDNIVVNQVVLIELQAIAHRLNVAMRIIEN